MLIVGITHLCPNDSKQAEQSQSAAEIGKVSLIFWMTRSGSSQFVEQIWMAVEQFEQLDQGQRRLGLAVFVA